MATKVNSKFKSSISYNSHKGETNFGKSVTKPNMVVSMREMLARHVNGITDNVEQQINYTGDLPDVRKLDWCELQKEADIQKAKAEEYKQLSEELAIKHQQESYKAKKERDKKAFDEYMSNIKD